MGYILIFIAGALFGAAVVFLISRQSKARADAEFQQLKAEMENSFKAMSFEVANKSTEQLLRLAKEALEAKTSASSADLEAKKKLIDQSLESLAKDMQERMEKVQRLMTDINEAVPEKYGKVSAAIENVAKQSESLREVTSSLSEALSGTQSRGQWGERMAEDILRVVGLKEKINYVKQKTVEGGGSRPDFTFLLPNDLKVNMDVKFPLNKYRAYIDADSEAEKEQAKRSFLNSVKNQIKEVTTRDYINPDDNTVDYVLVFIANERVYTFIQESDSSIIDEALRQKVILCSPLTLYAMLALIRHAIDNFHLRQSSREIQALLGGFYKQWNNFIESMITLGRRIESARSAFDEMIGTRKRMLERQMKKIEDLNRAEGIEPKIVDQDDDVMEIEETDAPDRNDLLM